MRENVSVLTHGSSNPAPDCYGVQSGPGHYRHFSGDVRHQLRDPLRHGDERGRDLFFYSMGRKTSPSGEARSAPRTLDISKVNQERHNWERIDTFHTPFGNGQVEDVGVCNVPPISPANNTDQTQAWPVSLEFDELRLSLRNAVTELKEELALAVNQTIAELRQDIRAEAASLRQHQALTSTSSKEAEHPNSSLASEVVVKVQSTLDGLSELGSRQTRIGEEMLQEVKAVGRKMDQAFHAVAAQIAQTSKQLQVTEDTSKASVNALSKGFDDVKIDLASATATLCGLQKQLDLVATTPYKVDVDFSPLMLEIQEVKEKFKILEFPLQRRIPESLSLIEESLRRFDLGLFLKEVQQWTAKVDLSPIIQAVGQVASQNRSDVSALQQGLRETRGELSTAVEELTKVRDGLQGQSKTIRDGFSECAKRLDIQGLGSALSRVADHDLPNALRAASQQNESLQGLSALQVEVRRVYQELMDFRSGDATKILRSVQQLPVADLAPVVQALQDHKRDSHDCFQKQMEEMQKLRRENDFSEVLAAVRQMDAAKIQRTLRENKVSPEDFQFLTEGLRRISEEVRAAKSSRELSQLLDDVTAVKIEVQRQSRRECELATTITTLKESGSHQDVSEVHREVLAVKDSIRSLQRDFREDRSAAEMKSSGLSREREEQLVAQVFAAIEDSKKVLSNLDLSPLVSEIAQIRAKVELASALKRKNETMTKSDFAAGLEELRGHFSIVLGSLREVYMLTSVGNEKSLRSLYDVRHPGNPEDIEDVLGKLRDAHALIAQASSRSEEVISKVQEKSAQPRTQSRPSSAREARVAYSIPSEPITMAVR